jgi:hypothetical protein
MRSTAGSKVLPENLFPMLGLMLLAVLLVTLATTARVAVAQEGNDGADSITMEAPEAAPAGVPFSQEIEATGKVEQPLMLVVAGESYNVEPGDFSQSGSGYAAEVTDVVVSEAGTFQMILSQGGETIVEAEAEAIWGWLTILPPLLAIGIALISRQVIPSLVLGIYL